VYTMLFYDMMILLLLQIFLFVLLCLRSG